MSILTFRKAVTGDALQIAKLINMGYRGEISRKGWTSEADLLDGARTSTDEILGLIRAADSVLLLCLRDEALIGCLHIELSNTEPAHTEPAARSAHFGMFVIHPELQGQGLGKLILAQAENLVQKQWAIQRCVMHVITHRHELIAFYRRRGYQPTGQVCQFPLNPDMWLPKVNGLALAVLEKQLCSAISGVDMASNAKH